MVASPLAGRCTRPLRVRLHLELSTLENLAFSSKAALGTIAQRVRSHRESRSGKAIAPLFTGLCVSSRTGRHQSDQLVNHGNRVHTPLIAECVRSAGRVEKFAVFTEVTMKVVPPP